jgi:uncharacterized integral membrane protein (TIGR00698 family)
MAAADPEHLHPAAWRKAVFLAALAACLLPVASPPLALAAGLVIALTVGHPYLRYNGKATKILLQGSVVGLGFGMNLGKVAEAGRSGLAFTILTLAGTLLLGSLIGRWLGIGRKTSYLLSSGTAICGGSAIAAVGPVLGATGQEMSVALGTVFILNAIGLFVFPVVGHALGLSQSQFGVWAAIAIHDTSSVVGAAAKYGNEALQIAATVKLTRALWIVPLVLFTAYLFKNRSSRIAVPWFIFLFLLASVVRTLLPSQSALFAGLVVVARTGLTITLFLIGAGLSRQALKAVGVRPLLQGVLLWVIVSLTTLWVVLHTVV